MGMSRARWLGLSSGVVVFLAAIGVTMAVVVQVSRAVPSAVGEVEDLPGPPPGDIDGDGVPDIIVGAPLASQPGIGVTGSAYLYSGADGSLVWRLDGEAADDQYGFSVAPAGDLDGDGVTDVVVGATSASPGGVNLAGSAYLHSGVDGSLIRRLDGEAAGDELGYSVAVAGDVDRDGVDDVIVGALAADPGGMDLAGSAYIYSGADGSLIRRLDGEAAGDTFGSFVAPAADVDGDGVPDAIVGAETADPGSLGDAGSAYLYSGFDGSLIRRLDGEAGGDIFGHSVAPAGDVDGDAVPDLIVGAPNADPVDVQSAGSAYLYSGADGSLIRRLDGAAAGVRFGYSVAPAGDLDGDGCPMAS